MSGVKVAGQEGAVMFSPNAASAGPRGPLGATALGANPHLSLTSNPYAALGELRVEEEEEEGTDGVGGEERGQDLYNCDRLR